MEGGGGQNQWIGPRLFGELVYTPNILIGRRV